MPPLPHPLYSSLSYHDVDLRFISLGQINNVHTIVIQIFKTSMKVFPWQYP